MSLLKTPAPLLQAVRRIGTSELRQSNTSPKFLKLKAKQQQFQVNDGALVHVKGGIGDKLLFQATMALSVVAVGMCLKLFYQLSFPRKS